MDGIRCLRDRASTLNHPAQPSPRRHHRGGAIGTSIAYHLAHEGITDVVLLERDRLTSGTTWHAAGLMTAFGNTSSTSTEIRMYTRDLFSRLEAETGMSTGFRRCGLVEALDESRMEEYRRAAIFQRRMGLESHEVSPKEMADLFPFAQMDGLVGGFGCRMTAASIRST